MMNQGYNPNVQYQQNPYGYGNGAPDGHINHKGQIRIYTGKCFRTFFNEKGWKTLISTAIIALILSWVAGKLTFVNREKTKFALFAMICGCLWTGLFNSIQSICRERAIIKREHRTGLHLSSYIIAHLIFEFCLCVAEALITTIIFGCIRGFPEEGVLFWAGFEFFIGFLLVTFCADALGVLVSSIVKTEKVAMTVLPFVLIIQLVLCGVIFVLPESTSFLENITLSKWGMTALGASSDLNGLESQMPLAIFMQNNPDLTAGNVSKQDLMLLSEIMEDPDDIFSEEGLEALEDMGYNTDGIINHQFDATAGNLFAGWGMLLFYSALYGLLAMLFLRGVDRDKR